MRFVLAAGILGAFLAGLNYYLYCKARRLVLRWRSGETAAQWVRVVRGLFLLMNTPYLVLILLWMTGVHLHHLPQPVLRWFFYPFYAWVAMLLVFLLLAFPAELMAGIFHAARWLFRGRQPVRATVLARRNFLASAAAVIPPVLFAFSARAIYGSDDLEVSPLVKIPVRNLPRAFDGLTITQLSDLHAGAYIRERELRRAIELANSLRSDLVVITGDILDASLDLLPVAQQELSRLCAPLGIFGILGNHDYYADGRRPGYPGCLRLIEGMEAVGVRMLRNQRASLRLGSEELLLLGLDWTGVRRGNPNTYLSRMARAALRKTLEGYQGEAPRILLVHHPHVFYEAPEFGIFLTLAGHTHGGGQIVIAEHNGHPLTLGSAVFRYLSGLYREGPHYLYVNRGVGFVGLPIRVQCPPEISRFQLVRA